jgi:hypothetical protein
MGCSGAFPQPTHLTVVDSSVRKQQLSTWFSTATAKYITDAEVRSLNRETVKKYKRLFKKLENFAAERGARLIDELDLALMADFRAS